MVASNVKGARGRECPLALFTGGGTCEPRLSEDDGTPFGQLGSSHWRALRTPWGQGGSAGPKNKGPMKPTGLLFFGTGGGT
jgi:hypothetical protein